MDFYRKKVFPTLAALLWLLFLFLDLTRTASSTPVKFAAICLCCVTALLGAKTSEGKLVALALCFTVAADWFLLVRDDHYPTGITLFIIVQFIYAYRLYTFRGNQVKFSTFTLRILFLVAFVLWVMLSAHITYNWWEGPPRFTKVQTIWNAFTAYLPLFYFSQLCINTAEAFVLGKNQRTFAIGLLLFVCCDLCVGAWNLGLLPGFTRIGMWLFYLPSQVLIVLSQNQEKEDPDEKTV